MNNSIRGFTAFVSTGGRIRINQTGDISSQTPAQKNMASYLNKIINTNGHIQIQVVSGRDDITSDHFVKGIFDIQDIETFGKAPGVSSAGALIHALEEQYQKQVRGVTSFNTAHNQFGVPAEEAIAGATRSEDATKDKKSSIITYKYPGGEIFTTVIGINPFRVSKYGCDPETKTCY